jgi:hypothetical protein
MLRARRVDPAAVLARLGSSEDPMAGEQPALTKVEAASSGRHGASIGND